MSSYATERKIKKLREKFGDDWEQHLEGRSIDRAYSELVGDTRVHFYCKMKPTTKEMLDFLLEQSGSKAGPYIERLIRKAHQEHMERMQKNLNQIKRDLEG